MCNAYTIQHGLLYLDVYHGVVSILKASTFVYLMFMNDTSAKMPEDYAGEKMIIAFKYLFSFYIVKVHTIVVKLPKKGNL